MGCTHEAMEALDIGRVSSQTASGVNGRPGKSLHGVSGRLGNWLSGVAGRLPRDDGLNVLLGLTNGW